MTRRDRPHFAGRPPAPLRRPGRATALALCGALVALSSITAAAAPVAPRPSAGCARRTLDRGDRIAGKLAVAGVERAYVFDAPENLEPGRPVPLLLDFHGIGHSGAGLWQVSGFRDLARREPFVTAYPEGLPVRLETPKRVFQGAGWEIARTAGNRDLDFVARLLDRLESDYCIDLARVYAAGFSNGAYFSELLGCTMGDRFAAVAPVGGGVLPLPCTPSRAVPILFHHGRQDELIEVEQARRARDGWLAVDGCPPPPSATPKPQASFAPDGIACAVSPPCRDGSVVEYCEGDFEHRWPASASSRIWEFFGAHPMRAAAP